MSESDFIKAVLSTVSSQQEGPGLKYSLGSFSGLGSMSVFHMSGGSFLVLWLSPTFLATHMAFG